MNGALSLLSLFLASSLILFHAESAAKDVVEDTCKRIAALGPNVKYEDCVKSLGSDPKSRTVDIQGLGLIGLSLLEKNLTSMHSYIQQLLGQQKGDWYVKYCLLACSGAYLESADAMNEVVGFYNEKSYEDVQHELVEVYREVDMCESRFNEKRGFPSPLTKQNEELMWLWYIGLAIVDIVRGS